MNTVALRRDALEQGPKGGTYRDRICRCRWCCAGLCPGSRRTCTARGPPRRCPRSSEVGARGSAWGELRPSILRATPSVSRCRLPIAHSVSHFDVVCAVVACRVCRLVVVVVCTITEAVLEVLGYGQFVGLSAMLLLHGLRAHFSIGAHHTCARSPPHTHEVGGVVP